VVGVRGCVCTSPSRRRILKLRLLILRVGELGKQFKQLPKDEMRSKKTCAMVGGLAARSIRGQLEGGWCSCCSARPFGLSSRRG
jgi:hypothetical protein